MDPGRESTTAAKPGAWIIPINNLPADILAPQQRLQKEPLAVANNVIPGIP
jgi:hypothetical protein